MGDKLVSVAGLSAEIAEMVREYNDDIIEAIPGIVDKTAKEALVDLRERSPHKFGDYAKGWRIRKVYSRSGFEGRVLYNKTDYQLTHLLEHGHANRNGGRTKAYPHIAPVADEHGAKFTEDLTQIIVNHR